jgi:hypothetical protein
LGRRAWYSAKQEHGREADSSRWRQSFSPKRFCARLFCLDFDGIPFNLAYLSLLERLLFALFLCPWRLDDSVRGTIETGGRSCYFRNNVLLLLSLILAVLISEVARFAGPQRYVAVLMLALSLVAFHIAEPGLTNPRLLIRLLMNENPAGVVQLRKK